MEVPKSKNRPCSLPPMEMYLPQIASPPPVKAKSKEVKVSKKNKKQVDKTVNQKEPEKKVEGGKVTKDKSKMIEPLKPVNQVPVPVDMTKPLTKPVKVEELGKKIDMDDWIEAGPSRTSEKKDDVNRIKIVPEELGDSAFQEEDRDSLDELMDELGDSEVDLDWLCAIANKNLDSVDQTPEEVIEAIEEIITKPVTAAGFPRAVPPKPIAISSWIRKSQEEGEGIKMSFEDNLELNQDGNPPLPLMMNVMKKETKSVPLKPMGRGRRPITPYDPKMIFGTGKIPALAPVPVVNLKPPSFKEEGHLILNVEVKPKPKEMFKNSQLYKQIKEVDVNVLKNLTLTPGHLLDQDPYKNLAPFDIQKGNLFQKLVHNNRKVDDDKVRFNQKNYQTFDKLSLGEQFSLFLECQKMTPIGTMTRWQLALDLFLVLRKNYPQVELEVTGSFLLDLGDDQSGLDIVVEFGTQTQQCDQVCEYLSKLSDPHNENRKMFSAVKSRSFLGLPSLLLKHGKTGIVVNLVLGGRIGLMTNKLLRFYTDFDPRVKPFLQLVRYWADFHGLTSQVYLNHYLLNLLALVYLMKKKIVPVVNTLQGLFQGKPEIVEGFNASFCEDKKRIQEAFKAISLPEHFEEDEKIKAKTVLEMTKEFCQLWGKWDTKSAVVVPLYGKVFGFGKELTRKMLQTRSNFKLPVEMDKPEYERLKGVKWEYLMKAEEVIVQDPLYLDCNAGAALNVEDATVKKFKMACEKTAERIGDGVTSLLELFKKME